MEGLTNRQVVAGIKAKEMEAITAAIREAAGPDAPIPPEREGWPCFSGAGQGVRESGVPVVWAPGQGAVHLPEGTGIRVRPNESWVIQVHYNMIDPATIGQTDQTRIDLQMAEEVENEGWFVLVDEFLRTIAGPPELIPAIPPGVEIGRAHV